MLAGGGAEGGGGCRGPVCRDSEAVSVRGGLVADGSVVEVLALKSTES